MSRGRHAKRSGLLARLRLRGRPGRRRPPAPAPDPALHDRLAALEAEVARLRVLGATHAAAAASADVRARRAEEQLSAWLDELAVSRTELTALRGELATLREELVWAFAEGRLPVAAEAQVTVVDLREPASRTA